MTCIAHGEEWRPVVGFEGYYEVSNLGNVRSVDKTTRDGRFWKGREIKKHRAGQGYLRAVLCVDGMSHHLYIHRLVAEAFVLNPDNKPEVNHKDGNKHNNVVSNLEWVTKSENGLHSYRELGRKPSRNALGKPSPRRKFTVNQVREIRKDRRFNKDIAKDYGVSDSTIAAIKRRKNYRDVKDGDAA